MGVSVLVAIKERMGGRGLEWYVAAQLLLWGVILLAPGSAFDATPLFFAHFTISEDTLGIIMLTLGVVRIGSLIVNGAVPGVTPLVRVVGAFIGCGVWFYISATFGASGQINVWVAAWPMACLVEFVNLYKASQDARVGAHRAAQQKRAAQDGGRV